MKHIVIFPYEKFLVPQRQEYLSNKLHFSQNLTLSRKDYTQYI